MSDLSDIYNLKSMNLICLFSEKPTKIKSILDLAKFSSLSIINKEVYNLFIRTKLFYFCDKKSNSIYFSDTIRQFSQITTLELDEELVFFQKNVGFLFTPFTIYKNIYRIPVKVKISLNELDSSLHFEKIYPEIDNKELDINEFEEKLTKALISQAGVDNCILHGGGADSSLLLALCKKNKLACETLTCEMTGMEDQAVLAKKISKSKGYKNTIHITQKVKANEILNQYVKEHLEVVADPVMPVIRDMILTLDSKTIIDGQGADTVLLAVPHVRLIKIYNSTLSWVLRIPTRILEAFEIDKSSKIGRKIYRIKKVICALSAKNMVDCLLVSWNFPMLADSQYLNHVRKEMNDIFNAHNDKYKMFIYLFLNYILPVREMQKYEGLEKRGFLLNFPYFNDEFVKYIYKQKSSCLFDGKNIKKPVYEILASELPGFIKKNNTKPFFVSYLESSEEPEENVYKGKKYPILDNINFEFTTYNIKILERELIVLKQKGPL